MCVHVGRSVISRRHIDLAVNKMDKITEELPIIQQHISNRLQYCTAHPSRAEVAAGAEAAAAAAVKVAKSVATAALRPSPSEFRHGKP